MVGKNKREKTNYPGIFYRQAKRLGGPGLEKVFYVVYKRNGRTIEEKVGRAFRDDMTPAKAARIRGDLIEGRRDPKGATRKAWTVDKLFEEFKRTKTLRSFGPDENRYAKYIKPEFGHTQPAKIALLDVERLKRQMLKDKSPQTVLLTLRLLGRIINFGAKRRLCRPLDFSIEVPKVDNLKTEFLTEEELVRLFEVIKNDPHPLAGPMMKFVLCSGMRKSELLNLQWGDIDDRGFIKIRKAKSGKTETIPLNDAARDILAKLPKNSDYIFPGRNGKRTDIHKAVNRIRDKAGLPKNFRSLHGLRHTFASLLASSGKVDMYFLQKLLTHRDSRTTGRYLHLRESALREASNVVGDFITQVAAKNAKGVTKNE
jgi:integrase